MSEEIHKPLYARIQEYIADLILSGKLAPEAKIQSEREFSEDLGVSRMTVRRALTDLVNEGLLERRHGSGTYVARPKVTYDALRNGQLCAGYAKAKCSHRQPADRVWRDGCQSPVGRAVGAGDRQSDLPGGPFASGKPRSRYSGTRFFSMRKLSKARGLGPGEKLDHRPVDHHLQYKTGKDLSNSRGGAGFGTDHGAIARRRRVSTADAFANDL